MLRITMDDYEKLIAAAKEESLPPATLARDMVHWVLSLKADEE